MEPKVYLKCDQYAGWSVVARDDNGYEDVIVSPASSMEEALRQFSIRDSHAFYLELKVRRF